MFDFFFFFLPELFLFTKTERAYHTKTYITETNTKDVKEIRSNEQNRLELFNVYVLV